MIKLYKILAVILSMAILTSISGFMVQATQETTDILSTTSIVSEAPAPSPTNVTNEPSQINIISPSNESFFSRYVEGDSLTAVNVTVTADVYINNGSVMNVKFYNNGMLLDGTVTNSGSLYSIVIKNPVASENVITAVVTDQLSNQITSAPIVFYTNIAIGKTVLSSIYDPNISNSNPLAAVDGIMYKDAVKSDKWYLRNIPLATFDIDLQSLYVLAGTVVHSGMTTSATGNAKTFSVAYYSDENWVDIASVTNNADDIKSITFPQRVVTSKLRYTFTGAGNSTETEYRIREIEVFGIDNSNIPSVDIKNLDSTKIMDHYNNMSVIVQAISKSGTIANVELYMNGVSQTLRSSENDLYDFDVEDIPYGPVTFEAKTYDALNIVRTSSKTVNFFSNTLMQSVNSALSFEDFDTAIRKYAGVISEFNTDEYIGLSLKGRQQVANVLMNKPDYEFDTAGITEFITDFNESVALAAVNDADDADELRRKVSKYIQFMSEIDLASGSRFDGLAESTKASVFNSMKQYRNTLENQQFGTFADIEAAFEKYIVICLITDVYWGQLESIFNENNQLLNLPLQEDYARLSDMERSTVLRAFYGRTDLLEYSQIRTFFIKQVAEVIAARKSNIKGGSSGGKSTTIKIDPTPAVSDVNVPAPSIPKFNDLESVPWAVGGINVFASKGFIAGMGNNEFKPNDNQTREQFIKVLVSALANIDKNANTTFNDTTKNDWHYIYIANAQKLGIVKGLDDNTFGVGKVITRQEIAVMAYRAVQIAGIELPQTNKAENFTDSNQIESYALESIQKMQQAGILSGMGDGSFAPNENCTRAQATKMIYEIYKLVQK